MFIFIRKVFGQSMAPAFVNEDYVVGGPPLFRGYRAGDVVVVRHARYGQIIKRITHVDERGWVRLKGDNPASTTSASLGDVPLEALVGRVLWRINSRIKPRINRTGAAG